MSSSTEKIKEKLGIVDVISSYLKLEKSGANYKANCPFHNEKTPSFFVSPSRESYYCFGCGAKGDIFSFVEQFEGLDFKGALKVLAERAGVPLESWNPKEQTEKDRLYSLMESAAILYENNFAESEDAQEYLKSRGVTDDTRKNFRIGYAPQTEIHGWRFLTDSMRKKNYSDKELILNGLSKQKEESNSGDIYDRFRDRIMFPISDTGGRVIAFSGRILHEASQDKGQVIGKYINSPETPIFKKGSTLYGLDKAKFEIRKKDFAILVEGQMDLVLSHQAGFTNTVASSGTALSDTVIADEDRGLLSGLGQVNALTRNLIIAYDGDKAGLRAAGRAEKIALSLGMNVKVAKLPKGQDPADVIRKEGTDAWKKIIDEAMHIVSLYIAVLSEHPLSDLARIRAVRERILPYIAVMPSAIERSHFIHEIHTKMNIAEQALMEDLQKIISDNQKQFFGKKVEQAPIKVKNAKVVDRLIGLMFWQETLSPPQIEVEVLREKLMKILGLPKFLSVTDIPKDKKNEYIFEAEVLYKDHSKLQKEIDELVTNLEKEILSEALDKIMSELSDTEKNGDQTRKEELLNTAKDISARLNIINSSRFTN